MGGTTEFSFTGNEKSVLKPTAELFEAFAYEDVGTEDLEIWEEVDNDFEGSGEDQYQYLVLKEKSTGNCWKLSRYFISWDQAGEWDEGEPQRVEKATKMVTYWKEV